MNYLGTALFLLFSMLFYNASAQVDNMSVVKGGAYIPLYGETENLVEVKSFLMDIYPVTNAEYLTFVKAYPDWKKSKVKGLFADKSYLSNWENDEKYNGLPNAPVTNVSWFAAKKYCECQGKRLPTIDEWELAAMASENTPDARK